MEIAAEMVERFFGGPEYDLEDDLEDDGYITIYEAPPWKRVVSPNEMDKLPEMED